MPAKAEWQGLFKEQHPVAPVTGIDPLSSQRSALAEPAGASRVKGNLRLGFACLWEPNPQQTWSGSASGLLQELELAADTVDLGVHFPAPTRTALKAAHTHYRCGRFTTSWIYSNLTDAYVARSIRRSLLMDQSEHGFEVILTIDTIASLPEPFFPYYDSSWDALISGAASLRQFANIRLLTPSEVLRQRDRQLARFESATGIITMSHWLARSLVEQSGVPAHKVYVVPPGRPVTRAGSGEIVDRPASDHSGTTITRYEQSESGRRRRKLLFVGRLYEPYDFYRKGADLVVDAIPILRREYDPQITLTMVGIDKWPLPGEPPDGVDVRGVVPREEIARLYETHDLFVMPSRMEPFGLVFTEALGRGMPCVARNACAMPEIVTPGISGALIDKDDPNELAETIASVLADDDLYKKCAARAPAITEYFSWRRAADEIIDVISQEIQ